MSRLAHQINAQLSPKPSGARRPGFGAAPTNIGSPDFQAFVTTGGGGSAWNTLYAQLQSEGTTDPLTVSTIANNFYSAYDQASKVPQSDPKAALAGALQISQLNHTEAGAVQAVEGLIAAAVSGGLTPQAVVDTIGQFTGVLVASAVAAGSLSLGVGALITIGVAAIEGLLGGDKAPPPPFQVGLCGLPSKPSIVMGYDWTWAGPVQSGPHGSHWRRFPEPSNRNDAPWFAPASAWKTGSAPVQGINTSPIPESFGSLSLPFWWTTGRLPATEEWYWCATFPGDSTTRPIDNAMAQITGSGASVVVHPDVHIYSQLEAENMLAAAMAQVPGAAGMFAQFQQAYFVAWKAAREYGLNGLNVQSDADVLLQCARFWNQAHDASVTYTLSPSAGPVGVANSPSYEAIALNDLNYNIGYSTDPTKEKAPLIDSSGNLILNVGPRKSTPKVLMPSNGIHMGAGGKFTLTTPDASSSSTTSTILTGTAVAAGAALLATVLYARYKHKPVKTVLRTAWSKTGGKIHVPHHLPHMHLPKLGRHSR